MTWTLALAVSPTGNGTAKLGASGTPEITGYFPEIDRAVRFSSEGEDSRVPARTCLIIEEGLEPHALKWYLGELVIAGIPAQTVQVRSEVEVLSTAHGEPVEVIPQGTPKKKGFLSVEEPVRDEVTIIVPGREPEVRPREDVALLALENPVAQSLVDIPADAPAPAPEKNTSVNNYIIIVAVALAVVLGVVFLI
ncbi:hypothetical protein EAH68_12610 [Corynebacterium hylobatis]|uniref:Uncharacterized protein n=1 Tax=Corynebacterium hylobatis TaxID=1859290 RepID=A0A3R9ZHK7_9CORY|nr:hypothetical protein [Corynebacterium hylobatis]RSZ61503.1 hypothetical protein EAH68_12610 [Corynebacterium hylobatis]